MNRRSFFGSLMAGVVALLLPFKSNENTQFVVNNSYDIDENGFGVWKCNGNFTLAKPFGRWRRNATEADFKELCSHVPPVIPATEHICGNGFTGRQAYLPTSFMTCQGFVQTRSDYPY